MANTISGRIHKVSPVQEIKGRGGNSFRKRLLVIDARRYDPVTGEPRFDNYPSFEFSGERVRLLDGLSVGDCVTVHYDVEGREFADPSTHEVRYFNTLRGYKVEPYGKGNGGASAAPAAWTATETAAEPATDGGKNDLPF